MLQPRIFGQVPGRRCRHGFSLLETLIAATLFAVVAIGLLPLLTRAMQNNVSGFDSNQVSQHARTNIEDHMTLAVDDRRFDLGDPLPENTVQPASTAAAGDEMLLTDRFWDQGARAQVPADSRRACSLLDGAVPRAQDGGTDCIKLGEGDWVAQADDAKGLVLWQRRSVIRQYAYADISDGVIDQTGTQLVALGHSQLFDRPLTGEAPAASSHFKEQAVELRSERGGAPAGPPPPPLAQTTLELGPAGHRTRMLRTF